MQNIVVELGNSDIIAVMQKLWDGSQCLSTAMDGYKLFRKDTWGKRSGEYALHCDVTEK